MHGNAAQAPDRGPQPAPVGIGAHGDGGPRPDISTTDPVCGMIVDPLTAKHRAEHAGRAYHFCSAGCRGKFIAAPNSYLCNKRVPAPAQPLGTAYTCPMHPEVRQVGPGDCPMCGMALEPEMVTAEIAPNPELADMTRRFWTGLALASPLVVLEMGSHVPRVASGLGHLVSPGLSNWIELLLATPVVRLRTVRLMR